VTAHAAVARPNPNERPSRPPSSARVSLTQTVRPLGKSRHDCFRTYVG